VKHIKKMVVLLVAILLLIQTSIVHAYVAPPDLVNQYVFYSYGYLPKVLNVYTSSPPVSGNMVTLYTYTDSNYQKWFFSSNSDIENAPSNSYRIVPLLGPSLALNYNQATTKCTLYPFATNLITDYPVFFDWLTNGYAIYLASNTHRYLGNSANSNGAQCYWYYLGTNSYIHDEDLWLFSPVTFA